MTNPNTNRILGLYANLMEEIKQRGVLLDNLAENRIELPIVPRFELCQLQIRHICEVLSLACLTAHDDIAAVRQSFLQEQYNAEKMRRYSSDLSGYTHRFSPSPTIRCRKEQIRPPGGSDFT
jgi:hypothetical protein